MSGSGNNGNEGFEAGMRRYWEALAQGMQGQGEGAAGDFPWRESIEKWTRLVTTDAPAEVQDLGARFQHQASDWFSLMQQVAARFAGRDTSAAEVAGAWREAVQGQGEGMLRWMLGAARGGTALNDQPWMRDFARTMQAGFGGDEWLQAPAFGPAREHQARWQALLKMQREYQGRADVYVETIRNVLDDAFKRFEAKLAEHEVPGAQLTSARAMFDLWIDAAEEAYAKVALSDEFQRIYADLANAQMRLRAASQHELERACETMGMPTRTEMDSAHKRIAELERQVRRLIAATSSAAAAQAPKSAAPAKRASAASATTPKTGSAKGTKPRSTPASKPGKPAAKGAAKKVAARKPVAKKAAAKKVAGKKNTTRRGGKA
ncbi:class III poly(R)-hydroxyalkanoic acid synthase subunit PhaE [Stenotrophomonas sp. SY1]|uniref:class III poly(R)-hydroxyalkanoic acid synthase subunit PhaE n=1 Tax=Stenotrophomonas sp. SY1 TaxID=477235 RepID=UPI001E329A90|nr:class III poly(R)-hydroxyalkanoic acid synthase subunit PhaE [Stenotrophomonas sp. SY1]MCD9086944.1 class III poly(R)-hydroxyalkanoic acid synthase subunit PhaE [Stenotrophomonas sp. SY1]